MPNYVDKYWQKKYPSLKKSIDRREARIAAILQQAVSKPQLSNTYWNTVRAAIDREYRGISRTFNKWAERNIPSAYKSFTIQQNSRIAGLKSVTTPAKKSISQLLKTNASQQIAAVLTADAIADMTSALVQGNLRISRFTRKTQQSLIAESLVDRTVINAISAGNLSVNKILSRQGTLANSLINQVENGRFITIIDKNGNPRNYRASYYAEMVSRTKFHEAQAESTKILANNYNSDLVRISNHNTTTEICQQYEAKIFSLSGKDKRFPILDQVPPFHVNCLHVMSVTFVETLESTGQLQAFSDFSRGETDAPPGQNSYVPVKKRNKIINKTITDTKASDKYKSSTIKQRRALLKKNTAAAIAEAA